MLLDRVCLGVLLLLLAAPARGEERFALVIGANAGWSNDRTLRYAEADAERMRGTLVELGGLAPERITFLREPDTAQVREALERLAGQLRELGDAQSLVVFYYSGHADERHLHLRGPPLAHAELYEALRDLPATVRIGILDACRSGSILKTKGGKRTATFQVRVMDELRVRGLALLTSSGADELAQETRSLAGSVFTHHLVSALRGAGDSDGDGAVRLAEAWHYAHQRTEVDTAATASPHRPGFLYELAGQGDPVLTWPSRGLGRLVLPSGGGERYVVVDEHQTRLVAEGRTLPEARVELALAPGAYQLTHVRTGELAVASLRVETGARVEAERLSYSSRPLSTGLLKGNPEELAPEELHEWRRGEAVRLLEAGEPEAALKLLEELLAAQPEDRGAIRARARALVRLADARGEKGLVEEERTLLRQALEVEPSLAEDPDFAQRYQRLKTLEAVDERTRQVKAKAEEEVDDNPYLLHRWGLALEVAGPRGRMAFTGMLRVGDRWMASATVNYRGRALGLGLRHYTRCVGLLMVSVPFKLCPTVGLDLHVYASDVLGPALDLSAETTFSQALSSSRLSASAGLMFLLDLGFLDGGFFHVELATILYRHQPSGGPGLEHNSIGLGVGWLF